MIRLLMSGIRINIIICALLSLGTVISLVSTANSQEAFEYDRWNLGIARTELGSATEMAIRLGQASCSNNWNYCDEIANHVRRAYDEVHNVWTNHVDDDNQCLKAGIGDAMALAGLFNEWDVWLRGRQFHYLGLNNMQFTIGQYVGLPRCPTPNTQPQPTPSSDPTPGGLATELPQRAEYYRNLGHETGSPGIGTTYPRFCRDIVGENYGLSYDSSRQEWACYDGSNQFVRTIDPVAMCITTYPQRRVLGVAFAGDPNSATPRYSPVCIFE